MPEITLKIEHTGKKCVKCAGEIIIRNARRWPHDLIIECQNCKKKYKLEVTGKPQIDEAKQTEAKKNE